MRCVLFFAHALPADFRYGWHSHPYWELLLIEGSGGTAHVPTGACAFMGGDIVIHRPGARHVTRMAKACRHLALGMDGPELAGLRCGVITPSEEIRRLYRTMDGEMQRQERHHRDLIEALAQEVVWRLKRLQPADAATSPRRARGEAIKQALDRAFPGPIRLDRIASQMLLHKDYLRRLFKREFGLSPIQYVIRRRLEEARTLLHATPRSVQDIASACGFRDPFHFSQLFKRVHGEAPTAYRKRHRDP